MKESQTIGRMVKMFILIESLASGEDVSCILPKLLTFLTEGLNFTSFIFNLLLLVASFSLSLIFPEQNGEVFLISNLIHYLQQKIDSLWPAIRAFLMLMAKNSWWHEQDQVTNHLSKLITSYQYVFARFI